MNERCQFDSGCTGVVAGVVICVDGGKHGWPGSLTGEMCAYHGKLIEARAPKLDPTAKIEWHPREQ